VKDEWLIVFHGMLAPHRIVYLVKYNSRLLTPVHKADFESNTTRLHMLLLCTDLLSHITRFQEHIHIMLSSRIRKYILLTMSSVPVPHCNASNMLCTGTTTTLAGSCMKHCTPACLHNQPSPTENNTA